MSVHSHENASHLHIADMVKFHHDCNGAAQYRKCENPSGLCGFTESVLLRNYAQECFVSVTQEYITIVAILRQRQSAWNCIAYAESLRASLLEQNLA